MCDYYTSIKEIVPGSSENYLRGRVIGLVEGFTEGFANGFTESSKSTTNKEGDGFFGSSDEPGFILQDDSGRIFIVYKGKLPEIGDIVGVKVEEYEGKVEAITGYEVLVVCKEDFYISPSSPNYKKLVIDLHLKEKFLQRVKIIQWIREFFMKEDFIETDTPELVRLPGMEPYLDIFKTAFKLEFEPEIELGFEEEIKQRFNSESKDEKQEMYLITSPEYAMKKLLVSGFEKIFQITKAFRNKETGGPMHNPEFMILEWYVAYKDYKSMMSLTQKLIVELFEKLYPNEKFLQWGEHMVNIKGSWKRLKVREAFEMYAGISQEIFEDIEALRKAARAKGYKVDAATSYDDIFFLIFLNEVEPKLGFDVPVILYEYPASMAALARVCKDNPKYAERFELYIAGVELCNGFSELNNAEEQEKRLKMEREERIKLGKDVYDIDQSFIDALKFGMPPSTGNALGVDRLIMLLTDTKNIEDILFFPWKDL